MTDSDEQNDGRPLPPGPPPAKREPPGDAPDLSEEEIEKAEQETPLNADITYEVIRRRGEEELARPSAALFFSGLAAGLSMGFSLLAEGFLQTYLPDAHWSPLISKLGYSVGFLMITLGNQQLFTENTLTAIIPLLGRRTRAAFLNVCRLWGVVLAANLLGAIIFAWGLAITPVLDPSVLPAMSDIAGHAAQGSGLQLVLQGIFAGWLIALMIWMLPATSGGKTTIVVIMTYLIGIGGFPHIIAGSVEVLYGVAQGDLALAEYLFRWAPATLLGNIIGGVALVSALNYAQVFAGGGRRQSSDLFDRSLRRWRPR